MGYVARALLTAGIDVRTACRDIATFDDQAFREVVVGSAADVFAIGGMYGSYHDIIAVCGIIRSVRGSAPIVLGGALATSSPQHALLKTGADIACIGPAEDTFVELVLGLVDNLPLSDIPGICFRQKNSFHMTPARVQPRFLAAGPNTWPAWELFDGEAYTRGTLYYPFEPHDVAAPILTARGCPYACNFCFQPMNYARRPLDDVFLEMEWLMDRYGVTAFYLEDDLFMLDRKRVLAFCNGLHARNIRIKFTATGRFNIVDTAMARALRDAGCVTLFYGGEAADDETLDRMHKKTTVHQMREGISITRDAGIFARIGFMFGQPGETQRSLATTTAFLKEVAYGAFEPRVIYGCVPFPGTELFTHCLERGLLQDEEDLFQRFAFKERLLDQIPVNMTAIADADPKELLDAANAELLAFYQDKDPLWMQVVMHETSSTRRIATAV